MVRMSSRRWLIMVTAVAAVLIATSLAAWNLNNSRYSGPLPRAATERLNAMAEDASKSGSAAGGEVDADAPDLTEAQREFLLSTQGEAGGGAGSEAFEARTAAEQFAQARTAPSGIVAPGAYTNAYGQLTGLAATGGAWSDVTAVPYDADDPNYRDYYSNSSGGAGLVTGRITGLTADGAGHVYAAAADGGVWRSSTGGGNWTPIADQLASLSSGALELDKDGALWYATGEANTGGTSYVGNGVYRMATPTTGNMTAANRVGGTELESTTINAVRFTTDKVWIATLRGVYWHNRTGDMALLWHRSFAPNPTFLPGGVDASAANAAYKNIINDIAIDPKNPNHLIAAAGWRSGDTYNGFYETTNGGTSWVRINPAGAINPKDIGNVSFGYSGDGTKLYVMNQSPALLNKPVGTVNSYLDGIYVSNSGSIAGPWTKIADSHKLANSGSALKQSIGGKGYGPGIQSWYNQFLVVDPANPNHVVAGLEEVYESTNGGSSWNAVGPYWNFYFPCWAPDSLYLPNGTPNRCPQSTHPDQHSAAVGTYNGQTYLFVGNDGGIYRRPLHGAVNGNGNATDWKSLNDGTIDALQYYAVDVGLAKPVSQVPQTPAGTGAIVSGGLQDNGGSIYRIGSTNGKMSSNFGGDGGDVLVDPNNGCNILQE
ncbi:MAG: glycosyl hydrolase, partial [Chloroflexota bacterium]